MLAELTEASDRINDRARGLNQPRRRQIALGARERRGQVASMLPRVGRAAVMVESGGRAIHRERTFQPSKDPWRPAPETTRKFLEFIFGRKKVAGGK
jgi:hypothetical protein